MSKPKSGGERKKEQNITEWSHTSRRKKTRAAVATYDVIYQDTMYLIPINSVETLYQQEIPTLKPVHLAWPKEALTRRKNGIPRITCLQKKRFQLIAHLPKKKGLLLILVAYLPVLYELYT